MQIRDVLNRILSHEVKTKMLRILCKYDTEWTGRQLAKELDVSPTTANKFLRELVDLDVVNVKGAGKAHLYSINNRNYAVKNLVKPFFEKEKSILGTIKSLIKRALLKTGVKIESLVIFGSIAQKKETEKSDIDLLVIIDSLKDKKKVEDGLNSLSIPLAQEFHTAIIPLILTANQIKQKYKENSPLINEILRAYILITGKSLERIVL